MKEIPVYHSSRLSAKTQVSDEDYENLNTYLWVLHPKGYPITSGTPDPKLMHQLILPVKKNSVVDHKDHNPLNNQRSNLRYLDNGTNIRRRIKLWKHNKSGVTGVSFCKRTKDWRARMKVGLIDYNKHFPTKQLAIVQRKKWEQENAI
jgi:hypothetical protein